ncbi:hypothetical protein EG328_004876 [Venturia inaequalis]|uniref:Uncharacterized protein n=1 Tax=Venturia inaequalis TaxID=5025 RepID=A0A8H3UL72_VENIN|nr:hypothetical protein EG328_004876 [Venturia inaequalis]
MKISTAITLLTPILPLPAQTLDFMSAKKDNICAQLMNGGYGPGRVSMTTLSGSCTESHRLKIRCKFIHPDNGQERVKYWPCAPDQYCLPISTGANPDAGCIKLLSPSGVKTSGDADNHACSSGLRVGRDTIYVQSSIAADKALDGDAVRECSVINSSTQKAIYNQTPCDKASATLRLDAGVTYQACISTTSAFARKTVPFTWHLSSPGRLARDLSSRGKLLSEMVTILGDSTADDTFRIVIGE